MEVMVRKEERGSYKEKVGLNEPCCSVNVAKIPKVTSECLRRCTLRYKNIVYKNIRPQYR